MPSSHHHKPSGPPRRIFPTTRAKERTGILPPGFPRMSFTIHVAANLKIVLLEHDPTLLALEARRVELLPLLRFQILPLNALVTAPAQTLVEDMVVPLAVRLVVDDVEICGGEGGAARLADEALAVVAPCKTAVCCFDGLADYGLCAAAAGALGAGSSWTAGKWWFEGCRRCRGWFFGRRCSRYARPSRRRGGFRDRKSLLGE